MQEKLEKGFEGYFWKQIFRFGSNSSQISSMYTIWSKSSERSF